MKSQRRHELETNELAKRLSSWGDRVQPYSTAITIATVAIAAGVLIALFVSSRTAANRRAAWDEFTYVMTSAGSDWDRLRDAADEHPDSEMSELARVTWADSEVQKGTSLFFGDQAAAEAHLEKAREAYEQLIDETDDPAIVNRARLGMGRVLETEGKPEEAIKYYQAVEGTFAEFARQRAEELAREQARESITWLASAEMPEVEPAEGPGTPGARPQFGSGFGLDPSIPARIPVETPQGAGGSGIPAPLASEGARTGQQPTADGNQPFQIENPFAGPSDPDRYAEPPEDGAEDTIPESTPAATPTDATDDEQPADADTEDSENIEGTSPGDAETASDGSERE